jgi:hypothetical protein
VPWVFLLVNPDFDEESDEKLSDPCAICTLTEGIHAFWWMQE